MVASRVIAVDNLAMRIENSRVQASESSAVPDNPPGTRIRASENIVA